MKKKIKAKRVISIIIFIIFLPLIVLFYIIRQVLRLVHYVKWKNGVRSGKELLFNTDISKIDIMEGYEFENYLKTLFFYLGYDANTTARRGDFGADLILKKDGKVIVLQAKRYSKTVGSKCVAEVASAVRHYKAHEGWVITNSRFTDQTETMAKENDVRLIDRDELIALITECLTILRQRPALSDMQDIPEKKDEINRFRI